MCGRIWTAVSSRTQTESCEQILPGLSACGGRGHGDGVHMSTHAREGKDAVVDGEDVVAGRDVLAANTTRLMSQCFLEHIPSTAGTDRVNEPSARTRARPASASPLSRTTLVSELRGRMGSVQRDNQYQ